MRTPLGPSRPGLVKAAVAAVVLAAACERAEWRPGESTVVEMPEVEEMPLALADDMVVPRGIDPESLEQGRVMRATGAPQVVFSNFSDGTTTLTQGLDNAPKNVSSICGGAYPKWGGTEARARSIQTQLQAMLNDFNIVLAGKRPTKSPYTMIMVGPATSTPGCAGGWGVAPADCNNRNPNDVAFNFMPAMGDVQVMAQELGHTFGLGHNDVGCDVMGGSYTSKPCPSGKFGYQDVSGPILGGTGMCVGASQNSYQVMKKVLGAWPGGEHPDPNGDGSMCMDGAPPSAKFVEPADGASVGPDFKVRAEAMDDCGIKELKIEIPSQSLSAVATAAPFEWNLTGIKDGAKVEIVLTPTDASGKAGEPARLFVKVSGGGKGGGGGGGSGGNGGNGGNGAGAGGGNGEDHGTATVGGGCQLASPGHGAGLLPSVVAIALAFTRRRRTNRR